MQLTLEKMKNAMNGAILNPGDSHLFASASIDSRKTIKGDVFFAMKGNRTDGHLYLQDAIEHGAKGIVISDQSYVVGIPSGVGIILVQNTLNALHQLAQFIRENSHALFVCITGSMGKTTTKEFAAAFAQRQRSVLKSEGNLNSLTGLPLSLIKLMPYHEIAVLEMAMNHRGEIAQLTKVAQPHIGLITNISEVHLEYFGTLDAIAEEKLSMVDNLPGNSTIIYNHDDIFLRRISRTPRYTYGINHSSDLMVNNLQEISPYGYEGEFIENGQCYKFRIPIRGMWNVYNLLAAVSAARILKISWETIQETIPQLEIPEMRGRIFQLRNGIILIDETYNSNPRALYETILDFSRRKLASRKIAILGDMLELGTDEEIFHSLIGEKIAYLPLDIVIGIGKLSSHITRSIENAPHSTIKTYHFESAEECIRHISSLIKPGDSILLKGSRGIRVDLVSKALKNCCSMN